MPPQPAHGSRGALAWMAAHTAGSFSHAVHAASTSSVGTVAGPRVALP